MNIHIVNDIKNDRTMDEIMAYGAVIKEVKDTSEQLHIAWDEEAGDRLFDRAEALVDDMKDNYEGLLRWIGSGL